MVPHTKELSVKETELEVSMTRRMATYVHRNGSWLDEGNELFRRTNEILEAFWEKGMRGTGNIHLATISKAAAELGVKDSGEYDTHDNLH